MGKGLHYKGRKHQKKRNVGLMYEFIVRHIIDASLRDDSKSVREAVNIIKRHFKPGTELYREWRLFNAIIKTQGVEETMANAIIRETRNAVRKYDRQKLDREKSRLIHEVNHKLGQDVYKRGIPNYTMYATVQTLFNDWRDTGVPNISRIADYEKKLHEHLMVPQAEQRQLNEVATDPSTDALVIKLMAEKLNKRYGNKLNPLQRSILMMYSLEGISDKLIQDMGSIKESTLKLLDKYHEELVEKKDTYTASKLAEVKKTVGSLDPNDMDDTTVARFMKLCELKEELE